VDLFAGAHGLVAETLQLKDVCGEAELRKALSFGECQHCPITPEDGADRVQAVKAYQARMRAPGWMRCSYLSSAKGSDWYTTAPP